MNNNPIFSPKLLLAFVAFAICTFALSLWLMGRDDHGADRYGTSSHSVSALGYAGIAEVLSELGLRVSKSRRNPAGEARGGVLIVAEPQLQLLPQEVVPVLPEAERVLLVLPKWVGEHRGEKKTWISRASRTGSYGVEQVLRLVVEQPKIERRDVLEGWPVNEVGVRPELETGVQLIKSDALRPIVATTKDGILVGELRKDSQLIWVLSDPDVIANHAFTPEGKGAAFAVALIERMRAGGGPVVFDETVHGFQTRPSELLQLLFEFPYSIITLQIIVGTALLLWATMGRFGPPEVAPPPLSVGKAGLIGNVSDLMEYAGHERLIIQRYVENTIRDTARQLHAPKNLTYAQTVDWLAKFAQRRGVKRDCAAIARSTQDLADRKGHVDLNRYADAARQIYQWKQEILDGPSTYTRHH